LALAGLDKR